MWLLSTDRAELQFFPSPELVDGGYAILSHTWGHQEQSFQDIQELHRRCSNLGENPRDIVSPKIRECCLLAERHGYKWAWIDSCCIDKTSSSELSEALNSMFRWYARAEVCYAFLEDVPSDCVLHAEGSAFRKARWHSRGWTLQELIAPVILIFVAQDWTLIGQKHNLAPLIAEVTGVRAEVLTRSVSFLSIAVAERMSWASRRSTTRIEDEAYCLMGLFSVNMPTIYGEGRQAFQRLQQEIMKQSFDTSLFAWDDENLISLDDIAFPLRPLHQVHENAYLTLHGYPLAYSPRVFTRPETEGSIEFIPMSNNPLQSYPTLPYRSEYGSEPGNGRTRGLLVSRELPRFTLTNHGIQCRFPIIQLDEALVIVVLLCQARNTHVGLLLHPADPGEHPQDLTRLTYLCGYLFSDGRFRRLVSLGPDLYNLRYRGQDVKVAWHEFFILTTLPMWRRDEALSMHAPLNHILPAPPFRIPQWLVGRLEMMGIERRPVDLTATFYTGGRTPPIVLTFRNTYQGGGLAIVLGTCRKTTSSGQPGHWARAAPRGSGKHLDSGFFSTHICSEDHLEHWKDWTKEFGDEQRTVRLSFSRCQLAPETTFVLHLELGGSAYNAMKEHSRISFPPRGPLRDGDESHRGRDEVNAPVRHMPSIHPK